MRCVSYWRRFWQSKPSKSAGAGRNLKKILGPVALKLLYALGRLRKPHPNPTAIFINELDAGRFECGLNSFERA
jgi:hypothetical protein